MRVWDTLKTTFGSNHSDYGVSPVHSIFEAGGDWAWEQAAWLISKYRSFDQNSSIEVEDVNAWLDDLIPRLLSEDLLLNFPELVGAERSQVFAILEKNLWDMMSTPMARRFFDPRSRSSRQVALVLKHAAMVRLSNANLRNAPSALKMNWATYSQCIRNGCITLQRIAAMESSPEEIEA